MENIVEEIWKDIPGYENMYQVSSSGNVKSLSRIIKHAKGGNKTTKERMLKPGVNKAGYYDVSLCKNGKPKTFRVHQLVAVVFLNHIPCEHKLVVDHINNIKTDNRVENLQLISVRENSSKDKKGYSSKYVGVHWCNTYKKWKAQITINGKEKYLGGFNCEIKAHLKYQETLKNLKSC